MVRRLQPCDKVGGRWRPRREPARLPLGSRCPLVRPHRVVCQSIIVLVISLRSEEPSDRLRRALSSRAKFAGSHRLRPPAPTASAPGASHLVSCGLRSLRTTPVRRITAGTPPADAARRCTRASAMPPPSCAFVGGAVAHHDVSLSTGAPDAAGHEEQLAALLQEPCAPLHPAFANAAALRRLIRSLPKAELVSCSASLQAAACDTMRSTVSMCTMRRLHAHTASSWPHV